MSEAIDRMWSIRDAVLQWLYISAAEGNRHPQLDLEEIQQVAGWSADPLKPDEVDAATAFLKEVGYITGTASWGGGIFRPVITSMGERKAAEGTSVRPGPSRPADPTGSTYNVHNYGTGNFNVGGTVGAQQVWSQQSMGPIMQVVEALDQFADDFGDDGANAQNVADQIRQQVDSGQSSASSLRALLGSAIGAVAVAAGSEIGQRVTQLAVAALQGLA